MANYNEASLGLLRERNVLLRESVELQRESMEFSHKQAKESEKRIGDYADSRLKEALASVLSVLRVAESQSIPEDDKIIMDHLREAIKMLEALQ